MKKFLLFLLLLPIAGGIIWFESRPTTVAIPIATTKTEIEPTYEEPPTTIAKETTTTQDLSDTADFSMVNVHLEVNGDGGDKVSLEEMVHDRQHIDHLPERVQDVLSDCGGVTDRDMAVRVDVRLRLNSNLPADVHVNYGTIGSVTVFGFDDGLSCQSTGQVKHHLNPGHENVMSYWVVLRGIITPEEPEGSYAKSWYISEPVLTLPDLELMRWKLWGSNVSKCKGLLGESARIWLGGVVPYSQAGCYPAIKPEDALGNM